MNKRLAKEAWFQRVKENLENVFCKRLYIRGPENEDTESILFKVENMGIHLE